MELLIENGFEGFADIMRILLNEAMKIERENALGAASYERTENRKGYANGYKPKTVDTRVGRLSGSRVFPGNSSVVINLPVGGSYKRERRLYFCTGAAGSYISPAYRMLVRGKAV